MGLADKLLCEVIQFNLRAATIIIAAMNMVGSQIILVIITIIITRAYLLSLLLQSISS